MASLFDGPVLGGLFGDIQGPERQAANMGLLGLGLGMLESGRIGPGVRNFFPMYQSGLESGQKRQEKEAEKQRREAAEKAYRDLLNPQTQLADGSGAAPGGQFGNLSPEQRTLLSALPPEEGMKILTEQTFQTPSAPTADIQKYQFAQQQGYTGTFQDFMTEMKKAGASNVSVDARNLGTIPQGYQLVQDGNNLRMEPIAGSPAAQEIDATEAAQAVAQEQQSRYGDITLTDIKRAREKIENAPWYAPTTGLIGNILKDVGGTPAADVQALTGTVRANIGFDRLQAMREASPTGGALGQVTERELAFLQATLGSIEQSQSEDQLIQNLDRLEGIYTDIMRKAAAYPNARQFGFEAPKPEQSGATGDWQDIGNGVRIRRVN